MKLGPVVRLAGGVLVLGMAGGLWYLKSPDSPSPQARHSDQAPKPQENPTGKPVTMGMTAPVAVRENLEKMAGRELLTVLLMARTQDNETFNLADHLLQARARQGEQEVTRLNGLALQDRSASTETQHYLISLLGEIATPQALALLLELAQGREPAVDRGAVLAAIATSARSSYIDGNFRVELSPLLEAPLNEAVLHADIGLLDTLATGINAIGTRQGIEKLLAIVEANPDGPAGKVVAAALSSGTLNPEALESFSARLKQDVQLDNPVSVVSGNALAHSSDPQPTDILLQWAANTSGTTLKQQALTWLQAVEDEQSLQMLIEAGTRYSFRDVGLSRSIEALGQQLNQQATPHIETSQESR
ncbi:MAG: hypothetical protein PHE55_02970 [Methylococcaceae bacterium]|nr:hypothetical protein [Methylococcaceae bacterium]